MDLELIRRLLAHHTARFCRIAEVKRVLQADPGAHLETLRGQLTPAGQNVREAERALFAAIALAIAGDAAGLEVLREPGRYYCTNSNIEVALANIARLLLGDLRPPLSLPNGTLLGELAEAVGAFPPRPR